MNYIQLLAATLCGIMLSNTPIYGFNTPKPIGEAVHVSLVTANRTVLSPEGKDDGLSTEAKVAVIKPVAQAMGEWAEAMPIWGADSVSFWAADAMKKIVSEIDAENEPLEESICKLQRAQIAGAYGLAYLPALYGLYTERGKESGEALHMCEFSDSLYSDLQRDRFRKREKVWEYGAFSCSWSQLFGVIRDELSERSGDGPIFNMDAF